MINVRVFREVRRCACDQCCGPNRPMGRVWSANVSRTDDGTLWATLVFARELAFDEYCYIPTFRFTPEEWEKMDAIRE